MERCASRIPTMPAVKHDWWPQGNRGFGVLSHVEWNIA